MNASRFVGKPFSNTCAKKNLIVKKLNLKIGLELNVGKTAYLRGDLNEHDAL
jgi:hypothetical protein